MLTNVRQMNRFLLGCESSLLEGGVRSEERVPIFGVATLVQLHLLQQVTGLVVAVFDS